MKNKKFIGFYGIVLALFFAFFIQACNKENIDLNPDLRMVITICEILASDNESKVRNYSLDLDEGFVNVSESIETAGDGHEFKMDGDGVDYSFDVSEWGLGTPYAGINRTFSGKIYEDAFVKNQVNRIDVVRDGNEWKLLVNGSDQTIPGSTAVGGYSCTTGTCDFVISNAQYPSLSACESACGSGGSAGYNCVSGSCVSVTSGAQYSTESACQSVCSGGGTEILINTTITGGSKDKQYYEFELPAGVKFMDVRTKETSPDATYNHADLFVKRGSKPTTQDDPFNGYSADCASLSNNRAQDFCEFDNPPSGTWHVMLYNYNGSFYSSNLVVTITR